MGNDILNYILLDGDQNQIDNFIYKHKGIYRDEDGDELEIWDCGNFLIEQNCIKYIENKENYNTGGRFHQGKNSEGKHFISIEGKNVFLDDSIKLLSEYYDKLIIHLDYRDEDYEYGFGWTYIRYGKLLGEDYISLHNIKRDFNTSINFFKNEYIFDFIKECKSEIEFVRPEKNIIEYNSQKPIIDRIINKSKDSINFQLTYTFMSPDYDYYLYLVIYDSQILANQIINLQPEPRHYLIDYFRYKNYEQYLKENNSKF